MSSFTNTLTGQNFAKEIAKAGLEIGAIKLRPDDPFTWASGYRMPIYNDNRMFLFYPKYRALITEGFHYVVSLEHMRPDVIAGTSTAGIPHATSLANKMHLPMIYIRDAPKDHGLQNQIEGLDADKDLTDMWVVLLEDLISTGGSSVKAVQAVRNASGNIEHCLSIFNYDLEKAAKMFTGEEPYDEKTGKKLVTPCDVRSLLTYGVLIDVARETSYINEAQANMLAEWRADPFGWGEKRGFQRVMKSDKK